MVKKSLHALISGTTRYMYMSALPFLVGIIFFSFKMMIVKKTLIFLLIHILISKALAYFHTLRTKDMLCNIDISYCPRQLTLFQKYIPTREPILTKSK